MNRANVFAFWGSVPDHDVGAYLSSDGTARAPAEKTETGAAPAPSFSERKASWQPWPSASGAGDWSRKLKAVEQAAAEKFHVDILSVRMLRMYEAENHNEALFALETDRGIVHGILKRDGRHEFYWKSDD